MTPPTEAPGPLSPASLDPDAPDLYEQLAEFHDLFMNSSWRRLEPELSRAFSGLGSDSTILDVGAGTGLGTRTLARCSPAQIIAIEPSLVMRSVLTARVADDPDLASRVTVMPDPAPEAFSGVRGEIDGFVCAHVLGHLDQSRRRALFEWFDGRLAPGGVGLVTTQEAPDADAGEPQAESPSAFTETRRLGRYDYRVSYLQSKDDQRYRSRYEVWDGNEQVREALFKGSWQTVTGQHLTADLLGLKLAVDEVADGVAIIRRP